jgi:hypothetical protein
MRVPSPEGATLSDIADLLTEKGIIDEPFAFEEYAVLRICRNRCTREPIREFLLATTRFFLRRASELRCRKSASRLEGMTVREIAELLEEKGVAMRMSL